MTAKADAQEPEKKTRQHALPLSGEAAQLIKKTAEYTRISIAEIKETIGSSSKLAELVEDGCLAIVEGHKKEQARRERELFEKKPALGRPAPQSAKAEG